MTRSANSESDQFVRIADPFAVPLFEWSYFGLIFFVETCVVTFSANRWCIVIFLKNCCHVKFLALFSFVSVYVCVCWLIDSIFG